MALQGNGGRGVRLHEKGGKQHEMPCNHNFDAYIDDCVKAAGIASDAKEYLFRTTRGNSKVLTANPWTNGTSIGSFGGVGCRYQNSGR